MNEILGVKGLITEICGIAGVFLKFSLFSCYFYVSFINYFAIEKSGNSLKRAQTHEKTSIESHGKQNVSNLNQEKM